MKQSWASTSRGGRVTLRRAPLEVGPQLREMLFEQSSSAVMTSATLAVGGSFDYYRERVGLPPTGLNELVLQSPFDFLNQALLCLPEDLPEPAEPDFLDRLMDSVEAVSLALGGRTLVLFTSTEQLEAVTAELGARLRMHGLEMLAQRPGAGTRKALIDRFVATPDAVLCGTNSFWEGIDLPGSVLSCVIIVRLPFRSPADPVYRARSHLLADPFLQLALPEAVLRLRQGFGRLIRQSTDRGAVVIFDSRVSTRSYGQHFLDALPQCSQYTGSATEMPAAISAWIGERRAISFSNGEIRSAVAAPNAGALAAEPGSGRSAG
jgi:Rad3-related DNA helicase